MLVLMTVTARNMYFFASESNSPVILTTCDVIPKILAIGFFDSSYILLNPSDVEFQKYVDVRNHSRSLKSAVFAAKISLYIENGLDNKVLSSLVE